MHSNDTIRLRHMLDAAREAISFAAGKNRGDLDTDRMRVLAVVFDAQGVKTPATRVQPKQFPISIEYVMVNGKVVVDKNQHTGTLAGRALRCSHATT
jgi:N-acyl-D-aspartate/D-glutamate deacylase